VARSIACVIAVAWSAACGEPDEPGPDDVVVTVYESGVPASGAIVWFSDAAGDPIAEGETGGDGVFFAAVPAGSSVTAALLTPDTDPAEWLLHTIAGTEPGDRLEAGSGRAVDRTMLGGLDASLPGAFAGAAYYEVSIGCRSSQQAAVQPVRVWVTADCLTAEARVAVAAYALDDAGTAIAFAPAVDVDAPATGEVAPVALGAWRTDFAAFTVTVGGVPAGAASVRSQLTLFRAGAAFPAGAQLAEMPAAATVAHAYAYPAELATRLAWQAAVLDASTTGLRTLTVSPAAGLPDDGAFDLAADDFPTLAAAAGVIGGGGSPLLSCQVAGDAERADGVYAFAQWVNPNFSQLSWHMFAPPGAAVELAYPRLPESMRLYRGVLAAPVEASVHLVAADHIADHAAFRAAAGRLFDPGVPAGDLRMQTSVATTMSAL
jgi:hypothetical protein